MKPRNLRISLAAALTAVGLSATGATSALAAPTGPSAAAVAATTAQARPDTSGVTICAHTNTKYCADVAGGSNKAGTKIYLYANGSDDHWVTVSHLCSNTAVTCFYVEDAQDTALCMDAPGTGGTNIVLENCSDSGSWYNEGGYELGNGFEGEAGNLDAQAIGNGDYLYAFEGGKYETWNAPGINS